MPAVSEIANIASNNLPYILAGAGAYVGARGGRNVHDELAMQRQTLVHEFGEEDAMDLIGEEGIAHSDQPGRPLREYMSSPVAGALATVYAVAGFAIGSAIDREEAPQTIPPRIEYVAPMAGSMGSAGEKSSPLSRIIKLSDLIQKQDNVETEAVVARAGDTTAAKLNDLPREGLGEAPLADAIDTAIETIRNNKTAKDGDKSNAALVIATAGGNVGSENKIIREANSTDVRAPVFFVDVGGSKRKAGKDKLEKVAQQTGGEYFSDIEEKDVTKIAKDLQAAEIDTGEGGIDTDAIILALASTALAAYIRLRFASKLPLQYHGSK